MSDQSEATDRETLIAKINELAVVRGRGHAELGAGGGLLRRHAPGHARRRRRPGRRPGDARLVADWSFEAVGGLTLGADPVAVAMLHAAAAAGERLDAFVVRKAQKQHGMRRQIEGTPVEGRRVLAVEDTSTTGGSVLTAVEALREAGADVVGVAVIVDRDTGAREAVEAAGLAYRWAISSADLGLA